MRIRWIIYESLKLPFKNIKAFLAVTFLSFLCEELTSVFYSFKIGELTPAIMIMDSIITLIILGIMMSITNKTVFEKNVRKSLDTYLEEGLKDYIISLYYLLLSFISTSLFIVPTGAYRKLIHIHEYIISMDLNSTFFTIHELSHQLPVSMKIDLAHSLQLNLLIGILIFIFFSSCGFIGKIIFIKNNNLLNALDLRVIYQIISNIGIKRYLKFYFGILIVVIALFNTIITLEYFFSDSLLSAILEAFILFFSTNAFSLICENHE